MTPLYLPIALPETPSESLQAHALALTQCFGLDDSNAKSLDSDFALQLTEHGLQLSFLSEPKMTPIQVDFASGATAHRRKFGGGNGQAIAKAVGVKAGNRPSVLDATAGLGRDGFVLASLGCDVKLLERNPVVAALLEDGLQRGYADAEIGEWLKQRLQRIDFVGSITELPEQSCQPDVVYLDPMFPHRQSSALVKKEMRVFQHLVGDDIDADELLPAAMALANKKVVVKRPDYAPFLANKKPSHQIKTKKNRFDVYAV